MRSNSNRKPYNERSLIEKIESNWKKTIGLFKRSEYSTVVIRAATTVELAANLVIRSEFIENRKLPESFVENLMMWANGLMDKIDRLLLPIYKESEYEDVLKKVKKKMKDINDERNKVVHRGQFKKRETAERIIREASAIITTLISIVHSEYKLETLSLDDEDEDA